MLDSSKPEISETEIQPIPTSMVAHVVGNIKAPGRDIVMTSGSKSRVHSGWVRVSLLGCKLS